MTEKESRTSKHQGSSNAKNYKRSASSDNDCRDYPKHPRCYQDNDYKKRQ